MDNETLVEQIQKGINVKQNLEELYKNNYRYILKSANKYTSKDSYIYDINDVIQEGFLGLWRATEDFDNSIGYSFFGYAAKWIDAYIKRFAIKNNDFTLSEGTYYRCKHIKKYISDYKKIHGVEPTNEYLAELIGVIPETIEKYRKNIKYRVNQITSLNLPLNNEYMEEGEVIDMIQANVNVEEDAIHNVYNEELNKKVKYIYDNYLSDAEKEYLIYKFVYGYPWLKIAEIMNVKESTVRSYFMTSMAKFRKHLNIKKYMNV